MTDNVYLRAIFHDMQQRNSIKKTPFPEYTIHIKNNNFIEIYGHLERSFKVQTNQLSDIHAILQLCHPDTPYCIHYDIDLSDNCPHIPVYSYGDAPNIITGQNPANKYNAYYIINLNSMNITIQPNETLNSAMHRVTDSIRNILTYVQQYPRITFRYTQLQLHESIPLHPDMLLHVTAIRVSSTNIEVKISICHKSDWLHIPVFPIHIKDIHDIYTKYHAYITHNLPQLIQDIHEYLSESQHEKIHISRVLRQYLTATDDGAFPQIQDCAHILRDHYMYVPEISPPN